MRGMIRQRPLPPDIATRLSDLGSALERRPTVAFAYLFGGAGRGDRKPLSDVVLNTAPTALVGRILGSRRVILGHAGLIDRDLRDAMVNMTRFRNVVVHE